MRKDPTKNKEYDKRYYKKHKEKYCAYSRVYSKTHHKQVCLKGSRMRKRLKNLMLQHYGNRCILCGENNIRLLGVDHINGKGDEHRKEIGQGAYTLYRWLIRNKYPDGFQILCGRCNTWKGNRQIHCLCCPNNVRNKRKL